MCSEAVACVARAAALERAGRPADLCCTVREGLQSTSADLPEQLVTLCAGAVFAAGWLRLAVPQQFCILASEAYGSTGKRLMEGK